MSDQHQIIVKIKADGTMTSEVKGVNGAKCSTLSAWVNQLGQVVEDKHTEDFYKEDGQVITNAF